MGLHGLGQRLNISGKAIVLLCTDLAKNTTHFSNVLLKTVKLLLKR